MLGSPISGLVVGPCTPLHRSFIARLSADAFRPWSAEPSVAVLALIAEADLTLVATLRNDPVGFAVLRLVRSAKAYGPLAAPVIGHLDAIAVSRKVRMRGVGTALLAAVEARAASERALAVFLRTAFTNRAARGLFGARGYRNVARYAHAYFSHQGGIVMSKTLPITGAQ